MRIEINAPIRTSDGKDRGRVYKVIIDPHQNKITHVVVETGLLFGRLIVFPVNAIRRANQHRVWLTLREKELDEMPDFVETEYAAPPEGWIAPFGIPPGSVLWPGGYAYMPLLLEETKRVPEDSIEVSRGTEVFALDGKIGIVEQVEVDPETKRVMGFVVAKSKHLPWNIFIRTAWVTAVEDGRLMLCLSKAEAISQGRMDSAA